MENTLSTHTVYATDNTQVEDACSELYINTTSLFI